MTSDDLLLIDTRTHERATAARDRAPGTTPPSGTVPSPGMVPAAVLLDRHSTLIRRLCAQSPDTAPRYPRLRRMLDRFRSAGCTVAVATHNRVDDWEHFPTAEIVAMQRRIEDALGDIDVWCACRVRGDGRCACVSSGSGVLPSVARWAGVDLEQCVVISDSGRIQEAVNRSAARNILRPSPAAGSDWAVAVAQTVLATPELAPYLEATGHPSRSGLQPI